MSYRRAVVGLVLLALIGFAASVPGQVPSRPIPTLREPAPVKTAELAEPAALDLEEPPLLDGPPPAAPPIDPGRIAPVPPGEDFAAVIDPPAPQVRVRVRVPAVAPAGRELTYRLLVENGGRGAANLTRVRATLPAGARFVRATPEPTTLDPEPIWELGTLRGCSTREIVLVVMPPASGELRVCARVRCEYGQCVTTRLVGGAGVEPPPMPDPGPGPRPLPQPMPRPQPPAGEPALNVRLTGPTKATLYDPASFTLEVANTGAGPARDAKVTLNLDAGLDLGNARPAEDTREREERNAPLAWTLGEIAPGKTRRIELDLIPKKAGLLNLDAEATAAGGLKKAASAQVQVRELRLNAVLAGPKRRVVGSPALYVIEVRNDGDLPATNVVVTSSVPKGITFLRADRGGKFDGEDVRWELGDLPPNERKEVRVELGATVSGKLEHRAKVTASRLDKPVVALAETVFENAPTGVTVEIDRSDPLLPVGKTGTYTVRVINQGDGVVEDLVVAATLPMELTPVENAKGPTRARLDGQRVIFDPLPRLEGRGKAEFRIPAAAAMPGEVKVQVEVTAKQLMGPLRVEESTTIYR